MNMIKNIIIKVAAITLILMGLSSCEPSKKDKLIEYNNALIAWVDAPNLYNDAKAFSKRPEDLRTFVDSSKNSIAKKYGYKDYLEAENAFSEFAVQGEIYKLWQDRVSRVETTLDKKLEGLQVELLKNSNPLLDNDNAPTDKPENENTNKK